MIMANTAQSGSTQAPTGTKAKSSSKPQIHHPKLDKRGHLPHVGYPFVASGIAPEEVDIVVGLLRDQQGVVAKCGYTLPLPIAYRWAIYFKPKPSFLPVQQTLEVFGIQMRNPDKPAIVWNDSVDVVLEAGSDVTIAFPTDNEDDLCPSNFVPYGAYNPQGGALTVALTCTGGVSPNASMYYDAPNSFWSAQFEAFDGPTQCNLTVQQDGSSTSRNNLGFGNC
jgi:hypothetical protein